VIASFGDKTAEALYHGRHSKDVRRFPPDMKRVALRKLDMLNAARSLGDFRSPPGNRLEVLRGHLAGHHSIRVNDQRRIVFRREGSDAHEVRLTDYH